MGQKVPNLHRNQKDQQRPSQDRTAQFPEWDLGPEDILQMDILPNLPPSGGYDQVITAIDVFSRYLFTYPVTRITATSVARVIMGVGA